MLSRQRLRVISSSLGVGVLLASLGIATLSNGAGAALPATSTQTYLVTQAAGGANGISIGASVSHDGRNVAFTSRATNLTTPALPAGVPFQAMVANVDAAPLSIPNIVLASHAVAAPSTPANNLVYDAALSGDGNWIVFASAATNLVTSPALPANNTNVHVYRAHVDRDASGTITGVGNSTMVDVFNGAVANGTADNQGDASGVNGLMGGPKISDNGLRVVFEQTATNLPGGSTGAVGSHIYFVDFSGATPTMALVDSQTGSPATRSDGDSHSPQISGNGQFVVYSSAATNVMAFADGNPSSSGYDVFRKDLNSGTTVLVSGLNGSATVGGNERSDDPSISTNGQFVVFESHSTNLNPAVVDDNIAFGTFSDDDVWLRDLSNNTTELISRIPGGGAPTTADGRSSLGIWLNPSGRMVSDNGRYVLFSSNAPDVTATVAPAGSVQLYMRDRQLGTTVPLTLNSAGAAYQSGSLEYQYFGSDATFAEIQHGSATMTGNGETVVFPSNAPDLDASAATNSIVGDIFAKRWNLSIPVTPSAPSSSTTTPTTQPGTPTTQPTAPTTTPTTPTTVPGTTPTTQGPAQQAGPNGYWMASDNGQVYGFGSAAGTAQAAFAPAGTVSDIEVLPGGGYYLLEANGRVSRNGGAQVAAALSLNAGETAAAISITPSGNGYWIFTNRGRVFEAGDAVKRGDMSATVLNGPILDSVSTPTGAGYYMVASDGGVFAFGDARFAGSMGGKQLNQPVQSLVPTATNGGYWLVAADGGIFAFGDAGFVGSIPGVLAAGQSLNAPITGMVRYGNGYLMVATDGGIFSFSNRPFFGSLGGQAIPRPIVAVAPAP